MVFHSYQFILGFLPIVYIAFIVAHRVGGWTAAFQVLAAASIAFYAQWGSVLVVVLLASLAFNYYAGTLILRLAADRRRQRQMLIAAVLANLATLVWCKYTNFLVDIANQMTGSGLPHLAIAIPIGVSFFTFVQVCWLVEAYNGRVERPGFSRYMVFAAFFPCVTAGPLVMQREMLGQMAHRNDAAFEARRLAVGLTLFGMGLFKKVVLADSIAPYANQVFDAVAAGGVPCPTQAWIGALAYALQLYFDFSGYSDMAIGLGCIFGLKLPLNFDSPFKATSIADFWRRWHMTMTRMFTVYVFTPLAMRGIRAANGRGRLVRFLAVSGMPAVLTFLVAGIWHGAGWTFVVYGLIHGLAIAINAAWRDLVRIEMPSIVGWLLTMSVVVSGLVVFRAPDLAVAGTMLAWMWTGGFLIAVPPDAVQLVLDQRTALAMIVLFAAIVLLLPNTQQILHRYWPSSDERPERAAREAGLLAWRPSLGASLATATAYTAALASIGAATSFLYYQF